MGREREAICLLSLSAKLRVLSFYHNTLQCTMRTLSIKNSSQLSVPQKSQKIYDRPFLLPGAENLISVSLKLKICDFLDFSKDFGCAQNQQGTLKEAPVGSPRDTFPVLETKNRDHF